MSKWWSSVWRISDFLILFWWIFLFAKISAIFWNFCGHLLVYYDFGNFLKNFGKEQMNCFDWEIFIIDLMCLSLWNPIVLIICSFWSDVISRGSHQKVTLNDKRGRNYHLSWEKIILGFLVHKLHNNSNANAKQSRAEPSWAKSRWAKWNWAEPSWAKLSQDEPSWAKPSQANLYALFHIFTSFFCTSQNTPKNHEVNPVLQQEQ